jgi:hypothetical protein
MKKIPAAVLGIVAALALALIISLPPHALSSGNSIIGYAWSDNIGWVSLSGGTYGLSTDNSGNITGYAWGDNIGWIRPAQAGDGCPGSGATLTGGSFAGWLRALNTGGDGCISLSGPSYQATTQSNSNYTTYADSAWGSDTVGWLIFNASGGQCTPTFTCTNNISTNSCNGAQQICQNGCDPSTGTCNPGPTLAGCISANSNTCSPPQKSVRVRKGATASIYWNVVGVTSCAITGSDGESWTSQPSTGTVPATAPINSVTTFTLSCDSGAFTDQATVNMVPTVKEI